MPGIGHQGRSQAKQIESAVSLVRLYANLHGRYEVLGNIAHHMFTNCFGDIGCSFLVTIQRKMAMKGKVCGEAVNRSWCC